jgi:hypothetical protein
MVRTRKHYRYFPSTLSVSKENDVSSMKHLLIVSVFLYPNGEWL